MRSRGGVFGESSSYPRRPEPPPLPRARSDGIPVAGKALSSFGQNRIDYSVRDKSCHLERCDALHPDVYHLYGNFELGSSSRKRDLLED